MATILKVDDEIVPLLKQYGLLPQLVRRLTIDNEVADFHLTQEETMRAYKQSYQEHKLHAEVDLQAWLNSRGLERQHLNHSH